MGAGLNSGAMRKRGHGGKVGDPRKILRRRDKSVNAESRDTSDQSAVARKCPLAAKVNVPARRGLQTGRKQAGS